MKQDPSPLCCCEYVNVKGERDHILFCCCNCSELDACVDNIICCRRKGRSRRLSAVSVELQDKMRIPWFGGARHVAIDHILPSVLTVFLFVLASQGWTFMILSFIIFIPFVSFPLQNYFCVTVDNCFHAKVFCSCIGFVFVVYEMFVIPQLEITFTENVVFIVLMTTAGVTFYAVHDRRGSSSFDGPILSKECPTCRQSGHFTDFHSVWYWCCIGRNNRKFYVISLGALTAALFDCSYLTITTICRPYELVDDLILIPEDCSDVFVQWQYSICFVSGVFSLVLSGILLALFLREIWFISIGFTITEWRNASLRQKLCLGLCSHRPHNRGLFSNWREIFRL